MTGLNSNNPAILQLPQKLGCHVWQLLPVVLGDATSASAYRMEACAVILAYLQVGVLGCSLG
jgi:hypothetical protein